MHIIAAFKWFLFFFQPHALKSIQQHNTCYFSLLIYKGWSHAGFDNFLVTLWNVNVCACGAYLKKPLQPSQVMALKWYPVAVSPHTWHTLGSSSSSGPSLGPSATSESFSFLLSLLILNPDKCRKTKRERERDTNIQVTELCLDTVRSNCSTLNQLQIFVLAVFCLN